MDQNSPLDQKKGVSLLEAQLRECFGRVIYSHKTHEKCADILLERHGRIKLIQVVLAAITTGSFLGTLFGSTHWAAAIGVVFSTILLTINAYTKDFDFGKAAQRHKEVADKLWIVREEYLSLLTDILAGQISVEAIRSKRDKLSHEVAAIYSGAPRTTFKGYSKAQRSLQDAEDMTFKDHEIDMFLPKELRKEQRSPDTK